jgi:predicted phosphodiesterase
LIQFLVVLPVQIPTARADPASDYPINIHLTYQHDPTSTITVTWQTTYSTPGDIVRYDTSSKGGIPSSYSIQASGTNHTYAGASGYVHNVELINLAPGTPYYFICGGTGNFSGERSFKTAPAAATDFSFVFGGDSRTNLTARTQVSQAMRHFNPSFVMHVGDMVENGTNQTQWDQWFQDVNDNWIGDDGLTIPVIPTLGNHENNATNYYEQFALPGNQQWYYYDWGPTLRIIVLNDEAFASQISGDEVTWLDNVLSSTPAYMWKIVMFHRNVYQSSPSHGDATDIQDYWVPVFDKYHVDLVVDGHTHNYARSKPMNSNDPTWSNRVGTVYVTAGGWGAPLATYYNPKSYFVTGSMQYHFVLATVYKNGSMHLEAKDLSGNTFDQVWLYSPLKYWDFPNGVYVMVQDANMTQPPLLNNDNLTITMTASHGIGSTLNVYCANKGSPLSIIGLTSWTYNNVSKMLTASSIQCDGTSTFLISWINLTSPGPGPGPGPGTQPGDGSLMILEYALLVSLPAGVIILVLVVYVKNRRLSRQSN